MTPAEWEDEDPPCECVQVDADECDASYCPAHGPRSELARYWRAQDADDEAAAAALIPFILGVDWNEPWTPESTARKQPAIAGLEDIEAAA